MLNKNGKLFLRLFTSEETKTSLDFKDDYNNSVSLSKSYLEFKKVVPGTGTMALSVDNVKIDTTGTSGLTLISSDMTLNDDYSGNFIAAFSSTYKNNGSSAVTITELGVYFYHTSTPQVDMMISRDIINKKIEPGETYTFTVTIG